nr:MerR family transcriptional regulator [Pseudonocardia acaciae]
MAARTGLSADTLRYYEREGLIAPPPRTNGRRRYSERDESWIRLVARLRNTGMPIARLRRYAELARAGEATTGERRELLLGHRQAVAARIAALQDDLKAIDDKIETYERFERRTP